MRAVERRAHARPARDHERVVVDLLPAPRPHAVRSRVDGLQRAGDDMRPEVGADGGERDVAGAGDRERLGDGRRAVAEVATGGEQGDRDAVAGRFTNRTLPFLCDLRFAFPRSGQRKAVPFP